MIDQHEPPPISSTPSSAPMSDPNPVREHRGPLAWMTKNAVASNLLMFALIFGGLLFLAFGQLKQEVFPSFALDIVTVNIAYPGASPEEVERAVTKAVEENVRGLDGIKTVTSTSSEGGASIIIELMLDADPNTALSDIKASVDRITSFPQDVERPVVSIAQFRHTVLELVLYGDAPEKSLRALADGVRDDLLQDNEISQAELAAVRPLEISVEITRETLRAYGLTLDQVAQAIRAANVEVPAGGIKTEQGEILLRTSERRDFGHQFADIVVLSRPDGTEVTLGEISTVDDSFRETDQESQFNGKPAAMVRVFRVGDQTPITVSDAVREYVEDHQKDLPAGVHMTIWNDRSEVFRDRIDLLMRNAYIGLGLVLLCLGLFLEIRLAFWVTLGIPISFLGALLFLPSWDISINMISLFAFIVTLGIVVDDAIVVGEAIYKRKQDGLPPMKAAIVGAHDVAKPVIFSVLTTIVAFSPLLFVPGIMGKFFRNIPTVVIVVLALSLVESLLVLPAHLSHENPIARLMRRGLAAVFGDRLGPFGWIYRKQRAFSDLYEGFIYHRFVPALRSITTYRWLTIGIGIAILAGTFGYIGGGRIKFSFMPKIEIDVVFAQLKMPYGTPAAQSKDHLLTIVEAAKDAMEENGGVETNSRGIFSQVGAANFGGMGRGTMPATGSHIAEIAVFMKPSGERKMSAGEFAQSWREKIGDIPGADSLKFTFTSGATGEAPISIRLSHRDVPALEMAAAELASTLRGFSGVKDVDDGVELGKHQLDFKLTPEARSLGITESDLARQVRGAFFGAEAARQQRGRDEVRVYVRLPENERVSLHDLEELLIRTPQGGEIPLSMAARVSTGRAYTGINRIDGSRVATVEGDVETGKANANDVMDELTGPEGKLAELLKKYPGLSWSLGGQQKQQAESMRALGLGFLMALILMYALMAIPFKSYIQPMIIMSAIPFGVVGALGGHVLMGYDLSILSMMGLVALSGVVVNDSLVLITAINGFREQGMDIQEAVVAAGGRRFRPIMLTSLTTFFGLAPMIFEQSMQARFLIPMALSLGFGVLFATFICLMIVPCVYLAMDDLGLMRRKYDKRRGVMPLRVEGAPAE